MMDRVMPTGHLLLSNNGVRTKRVSVLIGWLLAVTVFMAVKDDYFMFEDIHMGIHDDGNNVRL